MRTVLIAATLLLPTLSLASTSPNLDRLCQAAKADQTTALPILTLLPNNRELIELQVECAYFEDAWHFFPRIATHVVSGSYSTRTMVEVENFGIRWLNESQGKIAVAAVGYDGTEFAAVARLKLDAKGQPVMAVDHFSGLADPESGDSGTYFRFSTELKRRQCASFDVDAAPESCDANEDREFVRSTAGGELAEQDFRFPLGLGWMQGKYPGNADLVRADGQVSFRGSVKELSSRMNAEYGFKDSEFKSLVEKVQKKLGELDR